MKVLEVNISAKTGSTGKITNDIRTYLQRQGHDVIIAYAVDEISDVGYYCLSKKFELAIARRLVLLGRSSYKGNPFAFRRLKKLIELECPDIVHLHCINCNCVNIYKTFEYLAAHKIKTVVTHHAEFFYTGNCPYSFECNKFVDAQCKGCGNQFYATSNKIFASPHKNWLRMYRAVNSFRKEDLHFVSVSPWVKDRSQTSSIVNNYPCETVYNGLDTEIFRYWEGRDVVEKRLSLGNRKLVLHVTSNFNPAVVSTKGAHHVVEIAKKLPNVQFIIVSSVSHNIENLPSNVYHWGRTETQEELAQLYSAADVTLLTSYRETFSMVTAESLCCGTPLVGFNAGGPESIAIKEFSRFVDYGAIDILLRALEEMLQSPYGKENISSKSKKVYSKEAMGEHYLQIYKRLLESK